jgi:hypothetical protein
MQNEYLRGTQVYSLSKLTPLLDDDLKLILELVSLVALSHASMLPRFPKASGHTACHTFCFADRGLFPRLGPMLVELASLIF